MATTIRYREATGLDISNIIRLFQAEQKEVEIPHPLLNERKLAAYLGAAICEGVVRVADLSGRIVGAAVAAPIRPAWSDLFLLDVTFLVVEPHFRKHGIAQCLLKMLQAWATERKLPMWIDCTTGGKKALLKDRFIAMQGLTYMGGRFLFWPKDLPRD
jgi:GNAT superfamily N-acetyltransferase